MSEPYAPPQAELDEDLAPLRRWRNGLVTFATSALTVIALIAPALGMSMIDESLQDFAIVVLVPSLVSAAFVAGMLPRLRVRWVLLLTPLLAIGILLVELLLYVWWMD